MIADFKYLQRLEDESLAPFAARSSESLGRKFPEAPHAYRTDFQRDRERIIHSRSFRRLEYKTQVFINREGDHYRTRLTHTIEVSQIARTIARALRLNEDLAESIALAHDLGHTPFGHAGERKLDSLLKLRGGFEHNGQSFRVVDILEKNYLDFDGLNLTWETREGIIKHSPDLPQQYKNEFRADERPSLEAQIIALADEIAYNNHDIDDGISSGILEIDDIKALRLWKMAKERYSGNLPTEKKLLTRTLVRSIINLLASDLIDNTIKNIKSNNIKTYRDIKDAKTNMASFSKDVELANNEIKEFLQKNLYKHYRVSRMSIKAERVIHDLFTMYTEHSETLPYHLYEKNNNNDDIITIATDYIAGMTDRFAIEEHKKLTDPAINA